MRLQQLKKRWVYESESTLRIRKTCRPGIRQIRNNDSTKWEASLV